MQIRNRRCKANAINTGEDMSKEITRRDYLNGMAFLAAGTALAGCGQSPASGGNVPTGGVTAPGLTSDYYPPILTGMRGSHDGSFEVSHDLSWSGTKPESYAALDEDYDLVVVGGGISGLAAACFYQKQAGSDKRILILDNHDDFGGHAKRNEFQLNGQMYLAAGGSANFQDSAAYSPETMGLIQELGFDLDRVRSSIEPNYFGANQGMYLLDEHFGTDGIVTGPWPYLWFGEGDLEANVSKLGLPTDEQEKLIGFILGTRPLQKPLPGDDIEAAISSINYREFLIDYVGLADETCKLWTSFMDVTYLVGIDCLSLREGIMSGLPGLSVLGEEALAFIDLSHLEGSYDTVWMPDGNGSLVRQMVRSLIPNVAPGSTMDDLVTAKFDYSQLDQAGQAVRVRLNSTVVHAVNNSDESVTVSYVQDGEAYQVKAANCVMACNHNMIPYICPEMPEAQKEALAYGVRGPMMIANVLVSKGASFYDTGAEIFQCPHSPFVVVSKAPPTSLGDYTVSSDPEDPMVIYMLGAPAAIPNEAGISARDMYRNGRHAIYTKPFEAFEQEIRDQLNGMFGPTGFDADRDIEAITLNRWSHGYAYPGFELFDAPWTEEDAPNVLASKPFGRISIANSDATYTAYLNGAIDAAWDAVQAIVA